MPKQKKAPAKGAPLKSKAIDPYLNFTPGGDQKKGSGAAPKK